MTPCHEGDRPSDDLRGLEQPFVPKPAGRDELRPRPSLGQCLARKPRDLAIIGVVHHEQRGAHLPGERGCIKVVQRHGEALFQVTLEMAQGRRPEPERFAERSYEATQIDQRRHEDDPRRAHLPCELIFVDELSTWFMAFNLSSSRVIIVSG